MATTVYVGMSGGVDSSVTAALLKEQGYAVVGVYMKNWSQDLPGFVCPWKEDYRDAKRVAVQLGIPLKMYDFEAEYKQKVVDYMLDEYRAGRTPNPDIMCNQEVKFRLFLDTALEDGADMIATGHYARIVKKKELGDMSQEAAAHGSAALFAGIDANKDQSYFLYRVTEQALSRSLMPIGEYQKPAVRELAKKLGLATAAKKDSQGICFVGKVGIKEFLQQYVTTEPGAIIDAHDRVIGQHDGAIFYTIGQRHGLNVGGGLPYYVTGKDMAKNEVYVTTDLGDERLWSRHLTLTDLHWINGPPLKVTPDKSDATPGPVGDGLASLTLDTIDGHRLQVRTRYRAPLVNCTVSLGERGRATVHLDDEVRALTPGQSAVLYAGPRILGGGILI